MGRARASRGRPNHGIAIDAKGNVWIGGSGRHRHARPEVPARRQVRDAVGQIRRAAPTPTAAAAQPATPHTPAYRAAAQGRGRGAGRGAGPAPLPPNSASTERFGGAAEISFDAAANEAFVADGSRNRRVAVVDINTGAIKRVWGAYGSKPDDAAARRVQSRRRRRRSSCSGACAEIASDGLVYVCDRSEQPHPGLPERTASS